MRRRARPSAALDGCLVGAGGPARHHRRRGAAAGARDGGQEGMRGMRTGGDPDTGIRCDQLVELVTDYLEGALDEAVTAEFDSHLARCPGCDAYVDQMQQTAHQLGHVSLDGLPDAARARLLEAFGDLLG
jgi:hypothetical protein